MDNLQRLISEDDTWTAAEGENDGTPFFLRFRPHLKDFIATKKYNNRITLLWHYTSDDNSLMPSNDEMGIMEDVENAIVETLENDVQSVLAFVYTGQGQREWHWYSRIVF
jgi:hypothetical protein